MRLETCFHTHPAILMEGALGERLKREFHLVPDEQVALASMLYNPKGRVALSNLWKEYISIAKKHGLPFLATTPTRRANKERIEKSRYPESILEENVRLLRQLKEQSDIEMYVGGLLGCKGDAYTAEGALSEAEAIEFHSWQAKRLKEAGAEFLMAAIMPALPEAAGMARALEETGLPYIISFTIERGGMLIDGTPIGEAIAYIDQITKRQPLCYMTNCVHPSIACEALAKPCNQTELVRKRFCGIQANTSALSYAELDQSVELKCSDAVELADEAMKLKQYCALKIVGGCCGTDGSHIEALAKQM